MTQSKSGQLLKKVNSVGCHWLRARKRENYPSAPPGQGNFSPKKLAVEFAILTAGFDRIDIRVSRIP